MLQFITDTIDILGDVLEGGCRWVQLRIKDADDDTFVSAATEAAALCRRYDAKFIIDDRVHLVGVTGADGVHLGKNDMPVDDARRILGRDRIIGATANTFDDIRHAVAAGADYIGLGPYRFTTTKKKLSPILGIDGYRDIMSRCRADGIDIPVVAIGGITLDDIASLKATGVAGIAVAGLILSATDAQTTTNKILDKWKN